MVEFEFVDTIKIPMTIESRNTIDKLHWTEKRRMRQQYQLFIRQQMSQMKIDPAQESQVFSLLISTFRKRKIRDYDNLVGGSKQLIDALVNENFIYDDNTKNLSELIVIQDLSQDENEYTIITRMCKKEK